MQLSSLSQRILGALIEKEMATPQSYPLSVNALTAAANQTTNRDPVTSYAEAEISQGLKELAGQSLVRAAYARRSSTPKYEHQLGAHLEIGPAALAVLCVLLVRGPQTVGELRQRTDRLHPFADLGEVQQTLDDLAAHHFGALCVEVPRQPGQKEARWAHLLGDRGDDGPAGTPAGHGDVTGSGATPTPPSSTPDAAALLRQRVGTLEDEVRVLTDRVEGLEAELRRVARFVGA